MTKLVDILKYSAAVGTVWVILGFVLWLLIPGGIDDKIIYLALVPPLVLIGVMIWAFVKNVRSTISSIKGSI